DIATSPDGITWTTRTSNIPSGKDVCSIDHNWQSGASGLWVIGLCGSDTVTSPDGITWTLRTNTLPGADVDGVGNNHLSGGSNLWTVIGDGPAMKTAPDGLTWTSRTSNLNTWGHGVVHNRQSTGGLWVVGDANGYISTSTNGTTWTTRGDIGNAVEAIGSNYKTGGTDLFVAVQDGGVIKTSPDGVTWTTRTDPFGAEDIMDVAFGSMYTTPPSSPNGTTSYSKSGTTWTNTLVCDPGYTLSGSATSTCTSGSNTWTALGTCVSNTCGSTPTITNVVFTSGGSSDGDTRVAKCDSTTWYWGMPTTYTCSGGSWSGTAPTCHLIDCSGTNCGQDPQECTVPATCSGINCSTPPAQTGATITQSVNGTSYAGYRTYTCDMCFGYSGTAGKLMCDNASGWKGVAPICTADTFFVTGEIGTVDSACCAVHPTIAILSGGGGVIGWSDWNARDGSGAGSYHQRYDSVGTELGVDVRTNTTTTGDQYFSPVMAFSGGGYVIGWNGPGGGDTVNNTAFFQRYNSSGVAQGSETVMTSAALANESWEPEFVLLPSDSFMALWEAGDADGAGVWGRIFNSSGTATSAVFQINTYTTLQQGRPEGVRLTGGNIAVVWSSDGEDGSGWGIYGQILTTAGAKVGSPFRVNTYVKGNQGTAGASGSNV
ncbi:MAG: hypothetical protein IT567_03855, partial [Alphaproteobacteria bacterium]|nr:hypothetical protein [Alphaproteobacteria bacterium]